MSTAMYTWGTRDTITHATKFLGHTVSCPTHDCFYLSLTEDNVETCKRFLLRYTCGLVVWDNFQQGQALRDQRGGKLNKFLIGTTEAAHKVFPFCRSIYDDRNVFMSFDGDQIRPLLFGMRQYESIDLMSPTLGTDLFMNHCSIPQPTDPCFRGDRGSFITITQYKFGSMLMICLVCFAL
jgi:hypothetical protein